ANVPDGNDAHLSLDDKGRVVYNYTDENGKTIKRGLATPQEFAAKAMGLPLSGFDQAILSAAGVSEEAPNGTGGKGATKGNGSNKAASDMKTTQELLDAEIGRLQRRWMKKNPDQAINDNYWDGLKNSAAHVMQQNPQVTANEAIAVVQAY